MKLSNLFKSNQYQWWAIGGLYMQALTAINENDRKLPIAIALRLINEKFDNDEQLHLYIRILMLESSKENLDKASDLLSFNQSRVDYSVALQELQFVLWRILKDNQSIKNRCLKLLNDGYVIYIYSLKINMLIRINFIDLTIMLIISILYPF